MIRAYSEGYAHGVQVWPHSDILLFALNQWFSQEGSENGAMQNFGWRSRQMLGRYGASAAAERAREEHRRLSPADRL